MEIIETTNSSNDDELVLENKRRGKKMLFIFSLIFFGISYFTESIAIALVFLPFFLILSYAVFFKKIENVKTISIGVVTNKMVSYSDGKKEGTPNYIITLDDEFDFDLFGIPYEKYWDDLKIDDKVKIHESNGSILKIEFTN